MRRNVRRLNREVNSGREQPSRNIKQREGGGGEEEEEPELSANGRTKRRKAASLTELKRFYEAAVDAASEVILASTTISATAAAGGANEVDGSDIGTKEASIIAVAEGRKRTAVGAAFASVPAPHASALAKTRGLRSIHPSAPFSPRRPRPCCPTEAGDDGAREDGRHHPDTALLAEGHPVGEPTLSPPSGSDRGEALTGTTVTDRTEAGTTTDTTNTTIVGNTAAPDAPDAPACAKLGGGEVREGEGSGNGDHPRHQTHLLYPASFLASDEDDDSDAREDWRPRYRKGGTAAAVTTGSVLIVDTCGGDAFREALRKNLEATGGTRCKLGSAKVKKHRIACSAAAPPAAPAAMATLAEGGVDKKDGDGRKNSGGGDGGGRMDGGSSGMNPVPSLFSVGHAEKRAGTSCSTKGSSGTGKRGGHGNQRSQNASSSSSSSSLSSSSSYVSPASCPSTATTACSGKRTVAPPGGITFPPHGRYPALPGFKDLPTALKRGGDPCEITAAASLSCLRLVARQGAWCARSASAQGLSPALRETLPDCREKSEQGVRGSAKVVGRCCRGEIETQQQQKRQQHVSTVPAAEAAGAEAPSCEPPAAAAAFVAASTILSGVRSSRRTPLFSETTDGDLEIFSYGQAETGSGEFVLGADRGEWSKAVAAARLSCRRPPISDSGLEKPAEMLLRVGGKGRTSNRNSPGCVVRAGCSKKPTAAAPATADIKVGDGDSVTGNDISSTDNHKSVNDNRNNRKHVSVRAPLMPYWRSRNEPTRGRSDSSGTRNCTSASVSTVPLSSTRTSASSRSGKRRVTFAPCTRAAGSSPEPGTRTSASATRRAARAASSASSRGDAADAAEDKRYYCVSNDGGGDDDVNDDDDDFAFENSTGRAPIRFGIMQQRQYSSGAEGAE